MNTENKNHIESKLRNSIQAAQKRLAGFLNRNFNGLSEDAQKVILLLFGLVAGSICLLLIAQALLGENIQSNFPVNEITIPLDIQVPEIPTPDSKKEYQQMETYKQWLDSLSVKDRPAYHWIVSRYPGLIDSLNQFLRDRQIND